MSALTPEQRAELRRLEAASSLGPLESVIINGSGYKSLWEIRASGLFGRHVTSCPSTWADFLAAARNNLLPLLDEIDRLERERDALRAALERIKRVSSGKEQLEDHEAIDDNECLGWLYRFSAKALAGGAA